MWVMAVGLYPMKLSVIFFEPRGYTTHRVWRGEGKGYIARGQEVRAHTHTLTRQGEWEKYCNNVLCVCHWINKQHTHTHTQSTAAFDIEGQRNIMIIWQSCRLSWNLEPGYQYLTEDGNRTGAMRERAGYTLLHSTHTPRERELGHSALLFMGDFFVFFFPKTA